MTFYPKPGDKFLISFVMHFCAKVHTSSKEKNVVCLDEKFISHQPVIAQTPPLCVESKNKSWALLEPYLSPLNSTQVHLNTLI